MYVPKDEKLRAEVIRLYHDTPVGEHCHKLHLAISPQILAQFPWSKMHLKALKETFQTMPKMYKSN